MNGIAVIISCYNLGRTLADAVNSALIQTRTPEEILIVDDGSDDPYTLHVLQKMTGPKVRCIHQEHQGVAVARNYGVQVTTAPYLVTLDADDYMEGSYLEKAARYLDLDIDLAYVSCAFNAVGGQEYVWHPAACDPVELLARGGELHVASMWRRSAWLQVGGYDTSMPVFEVWDFWLKACELNLRGIILDEPLLFYRMRAGSRSQQGLIGNNYTKAMIALTSKHSGTAAANAEAIWLRKASFWQEQKRHNDRLRHKLKEIETDISVINQQISSLHQQLSDQHIPAINWGDFNEMKPLSQKWGTDRGLPVDRYYIELFLSNFRNDIHDRVLEIKDDGYTRKFGGMQVTESSILDINPNNNKATIIADLSCASHVASESYDCVILTQTLHIIYDFHAALCEVFRILKPGGVLLCTLPALSRVNDEDVGIDKGDFWRFTEAAVRRIFAQIFPISDFEVFTWGNIRSSIAFLEGLAASELSESILTEVDPYYPLLFGIRAVKAGDETISHRLLNYPHQAAVILMYHRIADLAPDVNNLCVPPGEFQAQLTYLKNHYPVLSLEELLAAHRCGQIPDHAVAITIDDGYIDAIENASPILKALNLPATFFLNSSDLNSWHEFYVDVLAYVFLGSLQLPERLDFDIADHCIRLELTTPEKRKAAFDALYSFLRFSDAATHQQALQKLTEKLGVNMPARATHRYLTGEEIKILAQQPRHTIGAHTVHHLSLPALPPEIQKEEIDTNRRILQDLVSQPVRFFSYPYGEYSETTIDLVKEAGFDGAVGVKPGIVTPETDPLLLPRLDVRRGPLSTFVNQLNSAFLEVSIKPAPAAEKATFVYQSNNKCIEKIERDAVVYNLTEHCNLNCYACDHSAPIFPEKFASYDLFVHDIKQLQSVFHSNMLRFSGGEPLLHPRLTDFLEIAKTVNLADKLVVVTNGLLLDKMPDKFWDLTDEIWLSVYPGVKLNRSSDEYATLALSHGTKLVVIDQKEFFHTILNQPNQIPQLVRKVFELCKLPREWCCHTVYEGRFYKCAPSVFLSYRLNKIGIHFDNRNIDSVDLRDHHNLFFKLRRFIDSEEPLAACAYCLGTSGPTVPHRQMKKQDIESWLKEDHRGILKNMRTRLLKEDAGHGT